MILKYEGKLTIEECVKSLSSFKPNKSLGKDGSTAEFYKFLEHGGGGGGLGITGSPPKLIL